MKTLNTRSFKVVSTMLGLVLAASISQPALAVAKKKLPDISYETVVAVSNMVGPKLIKRPGVVGVGVGYCGDMTANIIGIKLYWQDETAMEEMTETSIDVSLGEEILVKVPLCSKYTGKIVLQ